MPRKMPRGQRPGARRTIPPRQAPSASTSISTERTDQGFGMERTAVATPLSPTRRPQATPAKVPVDFAKEYHYVFQDLKNVSVLSAGILVVLIVLSFIIH